MNVRKIGPLLFSGLIIGPILGSGIIILPPLVHQTAGDYALLAWLIMMIMSFLFAFLFGRLSLLYPGDSGAAEAVEHALGKPLRHVSANFLILAVCLGPIAVLGTAAEYVSLWTGQNQHLYTLALLLFCYAIISMSITSVGKLSLILSSLIVVILLSGAIHTLLFFRGDIVWSTTFHFPSFGYSLLLLFWCLVGWEIIGNYSGELRNPKRTIPLAILFSCLLITVVSLTVAAAIQWVDAEQLGLPVSGKLDIILSSLYGSYATPVISLITTALCLSTVIMILGGVSRLISAQAKQGALPSILAYKNKKEVPIAAMCTLLLIHLSVFLFVYLDVISLIQLVAVADAFFLGNALIGIVAGFRLLREWWIRLIAAFLGLCFLSILLFSSGWVLLVVAVMSAYAGFRSFQSARNVKLPAPIHTEREPV